MTRTIFILLFVAVGLAVFRRYDKPSPSAILKEVPTNSYGVIECRPAGCGSCDFVKVTP